MAVDPGPCGFEGPPYPRFESRPELVPAETLNVSGTVLVDSPATTTLATNQETSESRGAGLLSRPRAPPIPHHHVLTHRGARILKEGDASYPASWSDSAQLKTGV
jgi:hypothetical protein